METVDLLIQNANEVITFKGPNHPRTRDELSRIGVIKNGSVAIHNGKIVAIGKNLNYRANQSIDAAGKTVLPGFIDPHTHLVYAGSREFELDMKLKGKTYLEILKAGGGIFYTVEKTRDASEQQLLQESQRRLDTILAYGTTTCEAKTGYGLNLETEMKMLQVMKKLDTKHPVDIVPTFLGAHAVPQNFTAESYTQHVVNDMIPQVAKHACFCDVFCEKDVFTPEQSEQILMQGQEFGLMSKIHADEIMDTGGAELAAKLNAISADHLLMSSEQGFHDMAQHNVVGVLLPGTPFSLMQNKYASARKMIEWGVPVALATDLNPNCWTENMQFIIQLACFQMKMTPAEAITAATFNAACAIQKNDIVGSLEVGKQADIIVLNCPNHMFMPYHFGVNLVETVVKKGMIIN